MWQPRKDRRESKSFSGAALLIKDLSSIGQVIKSGTVKGILVHKLIKWRQKS